MSTLGPKRSDDKQESMEAHKSPAITITPTPEIPGINETLALKAKEKYNVNLEKETREWMEAVTGEKIDGTFIESIKNGVVLCTLLNKIKPGLIKKFNKGDNIKQFQQMENIKLFLDGCLALNVPPTSLFQTVDLFEGKDLNQVIMVLHGLGRHFARKIPGFEGPYIANPMSLSKEQIGSGAMTPLSRSLGADGTPQKEYSGDYKAQLDQMKSEYLQQSKKQETKIASLERENMELKIQVEKMRRDHESQAEEIQHTLEKLTKLKNSFRKDLQDTKQKVGNMNQWMKDQTGQLFASVELKQQSLRNSASVTSLKSSASSREAKDDLLKQLDALSGSSSLSNFKMQLTDSDIQIVTDDREREMPLNPFDIPDEVTESDFLNVIQSKRSSVREEPEPPKPESPVMKRDNSRLGRKNSQKFLKDMIASLSSDQPSPFMDFKTPSREPEPEPEPEKKPEKQPEKEMVKSVSKQPEIEEVQEKHQDLSELLDLPSFSNEELSGILQDLEDNAVGEIATLAPSGSRNRVPSFVGIFGENTKKELEKELGVTTTKNDNSPLSDWKSGLPVVREYHATEDINKRGVKKKKQGKQYWVNTILTAEMEDQNTVNYPFFGDAKKGLFCVFDGHGGKMCAIGAAKVMPSEIKSKLAEHESKKYNKEEEGADLKDVFLKSFEAVDSALAGFDFEGCTATTVVVWECAGSRWVQCANVGDSSAFLKHGDQVIKISRDHNTKDLLEKERLKLMGVQLTEGKTRIAGLAVSRALGDHYAKQEKSGVIGVPSVSGPIKIQDPNTALILASDGLWDVMTGVGAFELAEKGGDAEAKAKRIIAHALKDPKCTDNITVMYVQL